MGSPLDSESSHRYVWWMGTFLPFRLALTLSACFCAFPASAGTLLVLAAKGQPPVAIADAPGLVTAPNAGLTSEVWNVMPGDSRRQTLRPPPERVDLYQRVNGALKLSASILVSYTGGGLLPWTPVYQMNEQIYFTRDPGGRWKPLALTDGVPSMVDYGSTSPANAQGYYASLHFQSVSGPIRVDAWQAHQLTSSLAAPYP